MTLRNLTDIKKVTAPEMVARIFRAILETESEVDQDKEHFWVLGQNTDGTIKYLELVTLGILNASLVHPREIFRTAILNAVNSIIICHNHPSGNLTFSAEDLGISRQIRNAGEILGIKLLDSIVVTKENYASFIEEGY